MIVQLSAGIHPPVECEIAVAGVANEINKEFKDLKLLSFVPGTMANLGAGGMVSFKSIKFITDNEDVKELNGTIEWICKSPVREGHKRKNWFIDISTINEPENVAKEGDIKFEAFRSSGAGGQNVNKVNSAVRATHIPTGITVVSQEERSQFMNKKNCIRKINAILIDKENSNKAKSKNDAWREGNSLVRGNPIRIYEGKDFKLRKDKV